MVLFTSKSPIFSPRPTFKSSRPEFQVCKKVRPKARKYRCIFDAHAYPLGMLSDGKIWLSFGMPIAYCLCHGGWGENLLLDCHCSSHTFDTTCKNASRLLKKNFRLACYISLAIICWFFLCNTLRAITTSFHQYGSAVQPETTSTNDSL